MNRTRPYPIYHTGVAIQYYSTRFKAYTALFSWQVISFFRFSFRCAAYYYAEKDDDKVPFSQKVRPAYFSLNWSFFEDAAGIYKND